MDQASSSPSSFLSRAGPLVLARLAAAAITFVIPLVLARALDLAEYGTYKQLFLVAMTLYVILPMGVGQSLYYFLPRADGKRPFLGQTLFFLLGTGILGLVLIFALGGVITDRFSNPELLEHRWTLGLYVVGLIASYPLEISLTAQGRTKESAIIYLVSDGLRAVAMIAPVALGFGLRGAMFAMAGWGVLRLAASWILLLGRTQGPLFDRAVFKRQLLYALPFGAAMLLSMPPTYAHQYAVSAIATPELFAIYAVGCFQLPLVDLLYTPTSEVLMVRLGELEKTSRYELAAEAFREAASRLAFIFLPMAAFLFAAAPEFVGALFGMKFLPAVPILRVSLISIALSILPMDGVLRAHNNTRHIFFSYLVKAAVTVPLVLIGVKKFGMMGGICAWGLTELTGKAMLLWRVPSALSAPGKPLRFRDVIPWRAFAKASLAAVAGAGAVVILRQFLSSTWRALPHDLAWRLLPLGVAGLLFVVGYFVALRAVGVRPLNVIGAFVRR